MNNFVALPVSQGDSFFLKTNDFKVLVDGGKNPTAISNFVRNIANTTSLDVLICTHNDSDHANGVIGLLESWEGTIKEVWVPGSWTHRLSDLIKRPHDFYSELLECIPSDTDLELVNGLLSGSPIIKSESTESAEEFSLESIFEFEPEEHTEDTFLYTISTLLNRLFLHRSIKIIYISKLLELAARIRTIVTLAYHRGCKIRFFQYGTTPGGGIPSTLLPVNSAEMLKLVKRKVDPVTYLSLTVVNKESIAFISPENPDKPCVLFSADTDLKGYSITSPCTLPPLITAPHHGSEENNNVYLVVNNWLTASKVSPTWVRSDGKSSTRPGATFKASRMKYCTLCNTRHARKQPLKFTGNNSGWHAETGTSPCSCI
jgi:hypothetical protein